MTAGKSRRWPVTVTVTGRPAARTPATRASSLLRPGVGCVGSAGVVVTVRRGAEHVKDCAQLAEPLLARGADRLQRLGRLGWPVAQQLRRGGGLHGDGGHRVRDHVVQLAGDAQPLLLDAPLGVNRGLPRRLYAGGVHVGPVGDRDPDEQGDRVVRRDDPE